MRMRSISTALAAALLLPTMALGYTGVFRSAFLSTSGSNPTGIIVGDFDSDGATDVGVSTADGTGSLNISVGLFSCDGGDRNGQFCPALPCPGGTCKPDGTLSLVDSISLGSFPSAMLPGRFDGDDIDDVIVAQPNNDSIAFLKGLGNQSFFATPSAPIGVGESPVGLASADINGDGNLDLVTANEGVEPAPGSVTVLLGNGTGGFTLVQQVDPEDPQGEPIDSLPADGGTRAVAIGDVIGDAELDILALNTRGRTTPTISVFIGQGDGAFTPGDPIDVATETQDMLLRDLNDDGELDLVLAKFTDDAVSVRFGSGNGTFGAEESYPVGIAPNRILLGNMGGDSRDDLMVSNNRSGDVSVLIADGPGTFAQARTYFADAEPQVFGLGDFNLDGALDVALATQGSDVGASIALLRNRGGGTLHGVEDLSGAPGVSDLAAADLDGDGSPDLLAAGGAGQVLMFSSRPDGFSAPQAFNIGGRTLGVAAFDMNGDIHPDIVATNIEGNSFAILLSQQGSGRFAPPMVFDTAAGPGQLTIGDFNNDSRPDVAVSAASGAGVCNGGSNDGESCVREEDCPNGGICARPGKASVRLQQPDGTFGPVRNTDVEETPLGIVAIDGNCDGRDDLVVANLASSTVSVLRSNGDGSFTSVQTLPENEAGVSPIDVTVADFDRDGIDDFAVVNNHAEDDNIRLFRGDCSGTFTPFPGGKLKSSQLLRSVVARDFNGDQIVDVVVTSQNQNQVCLALGSGTGTLSHVGQGSCDGVSRMPIAAAAADFDSDGRYDAASANSAATSNNLSVLLNCVRDPGCDPFGTPLPGVAALRGDGNGDGRASAADLVRVAAEVMDGDGFRVEAVAQEDAVVATAGVDANGDGRVDAQDRLAVARRIFGGV